MTALDANARRILEVILRSPNSAVDEIALECPHLMWSQVFQIVDQLSQDGIIKLTPKDPGGYTIHLVKTQEPAGQHHVVV